MIGIRQWINNLTDKLIQGPNDWNLPSDVRIHKGFLETYNKLKKLFLPYYQQMRSRNPNKMTIVGGHSRGASLATLSAFDLKKNYNYPVTMFNGGSPPVGNFAFIREYWKVLKNFSYRHVHKSDAVPQVPFADFKHVPAEIWEGDDNKFTVCKINEAQPWVQDPNCSIQLKNNYDYDIDIKIPNPFNTLSFGSRFKRFFRRSASKVFRGVKRTTGRAFTKAKFFWK